MGMTLPERFNGIEPCPVCGDSDDHEPILDENALIAWVVCWSCTYEGPEYDRVFRPARLDGSTVSDRHLALGAIRRWNSWAVRCWLNGTVLAWPADEP